MRMRFKDKLQIILQLSKVKITIAVSLTTITGYVLGNGKFDFGFIGVTVGIFLLACGASVLNHIQESRTDAVMQRTQKRPIPSGRISRNRAFLLFLAETVSGALLLYLTSGLPALLLGLLALVWYNFIYTYLKKITAHAVIPGSVIGAIPPLVGWVASGATLIDPRAWTMALFFFVWQVPHFYLLVLKYGTQYEEAGFPSLTARYKVQHIHLMIFLWIITTTITSLLLYYFQVIRSRLSITIVLLASIWLVAVFLQPLIGRKKERTSFYYFMRINYYVLLIMIVMNLDYLFLRHLL